LIYRAENIESGGGFAMKAILCGTGEILYYMVKILTREGDDVVVICPNHQECVQLAQSFNVAVACGNPTDESLLEEVGIKQHPTVICLFPKDTDNYVAVDFMMQRYNLPSLITLVNNPRNETIFKQTGQVETLCLPQIIVDCLKKK
jgi:trk system potassium uptake protein TrkA